MERKVPRLSGKTALVTGAAKRIGRGVALALSEAGVHVVVHCGTSRDEAEDTAARIRERGTRAWVLQADLSSPAETRSLFARAGESAGALDFLVNSASIFPKSRLGDFTPEELAESLRVNAMAPLDLSRSFAAQGREGAIVNFLDTRVTGFDKSHAAYSISKNVLLNLTRMMALEFAPRVSVNAVAPGLILPPPGEDESYLQRLAHTNPMHKAGSVEGIAEAVLFLLGSDFITGQVLFVDGGRHLRGGVQE
jgi:pteridine reductase